jgi:hypothetical protein
MADGRRTATADRQRPELWSARRVEGDESGIEVPVDVDDDAGDRRRCVEPAAGLE